MGYVSFREGNKKKTNPLKKITKNDLTQGERSSFWGFVMVVGFQIYWSEI